MRLVDLAILGLAALLPASELRAQSMPVAPGSPELRTAILPVSLPDLARLPDDRIRIHAQAKLLPDGRLEGLARIEAQGVSAGLLAQFLESVRSVPLERLSTLMMQRQMLDGRVLRLQVQPEDAQRSKTVELGYQLMPSIERDGRRSLALAPGPRLVRGAYVNLVSHLREKRQGEAACPFQSLEQSQNITLPEGQGAITLPPDVTIQLGATSYHARYVRDRTTLNILRRLVLDAGALQCTPEKLREIAPVIHAAAHDMARRLIFD